MNKKVTQSITIVSGFLTLVLTTVIQLGFLPASSVGEGNQVIESAAELARNIAAFATVFGMRKAIK